MLKSRLESQSSRRDFSFHHSTIADSLLPHTALLLGEARRYITLIRDIAFIWKTHI